MKNTLAHRFARPLAGLGLAAIVIFAMAPGVFAQERRAALDPERRAELIERWRAKSIDQRRAIVERFKDLRDLDPEARAAFERRAKALLRERGRIAERWPTDWRAALAGMDARTRHQTLRDWQHGGARFQGARLGRKLPPELDRMLHQSAPARRPQQLERWTKDREPKLLEFGLSELDRVLGVGAARIEEIRAMEPEMRRQTILALRREALRKEVSVAGPPLGLDAGRWTELESLSDAAFFGALRGLAREELARTVETIDDGRHARPRPDRDLVTALAALFDGHRGALSGPRPDARAAQRETLRASPAERPGLIASRLRERIVEALAADTRIESGARQTLLSASPEELLGALRHLAPRPFERRAPEHAESPERRGKEPVVGPRKSDR